MLNLRALHLGTFNLGTFNFGILNIGPICRALRQRKLSAALLALQIGLATAILSTSVFVATELDRPYQSNSGINDTQLSALVIRTAEGPISYAMAQRDLEVINKFSTVERSALLRWAPFTKAADLGELRTAKDARAQKVIVATCDASTTVISTLGLKLIAGRDFRDDDMTIEAEASARNNVKIIITSILAKQLFQTDALAIGKSVYDGDSSYEIIGVTRDWLGFGLFPNQLNEKTVFIPHYWEKDPEQRYLIRTQTAEARQATIELIVQALKVLHRNQAFIFDESLDSNKHHSYLQDHKISSLLKALNILLCLVVAFAISGQTLFGVNQRIKQIGVRRALGASQNQIVLWLIIENICICTPGLFLGIFLSLLANQKISELGYHSMPAIYLIEACFLFIALTLACTFVPAWQAAKIPPSIASKTS